MEINDKTLKMFSENGYENYLDLLGIMQRFYGTFYFKSIHPIQDKENFEIGRSSLILLQSNCYRSKMLAKSYIQGLNNENPFTTALSSRAHYETTGVLAFLLKKYRQYLKSDITRNQLETILKSLLWGVMDKWDFPEDTPDPINALKLIDAIDYFMKIKYQKKEKNFRGAYEFLSEICHPNSYGNLLAINIKKSKFRDELETYDAFSYNIGSFFQSFNAYRDIYLELLDEILKHEDIPQEFKGGNALPRNEIEK